MKTCCRTKIIISTMMLMAGSAVYAAEQAPAPTPPPAAADVASAAQQDGKAAQPAPLEESLTINMKVPLFAPSFADTPVAAVNGEDVLISELTNALGAMHEGMLEQKATARKSYADVLNRLVNMKLLVQEAKNIQLDELPQVKGLVEVYEKTSLREQLFKQHLKGIKPDPKEVEKLYREQIKQWKIKTLSFDKEANAKKMAQELKAGKDFNELAQSALKGGLAKGGTESVYLQTQGIAPQIVRALAGMKVGGFSSVIPMETGYAIVKLEDVRYLESADAKEEAEKAVLNQARKKSLQAYRDQLVKKYAKINSKLLKTLDFEAAKPGLKALMRDQRTLVEISGEQPVTVADLSKGISDRFFHGASRAIKEKQVNVLKNEVLEELLQKRLFVKEALLQEVDKSADYRDSLKAYQDSIYFGMFVEKVIRTEVSVTEGDLMEYYKAHVKEYTSPEMIRMNGLVFTSIEAAQACLDKLRQGAEFKWLKETMEGQVPSDTPNLLKLDGNPISTAEVSPELRKTLTGAHSNDYRIYSDGAGHFYALHILETVAPKERPYAEVRELIAKPVYDKAVIRTIEEWAEKLRKASDIKVYADFGDIS